MVGIIDYNTGNLKSVQNALARLKADYIITSDLTLLSRCSQIILPGVGNAAWAMENLKKSGLADAIKLFTQPVLGICLGMQIMCRFSEEDNTPCLGIFDNEVKHICNCTNENIKIPHIGWNNIDKLDSALYNNVSDGEYVYFVHSYCADVNRNTIARCHYGTEFSASLKKDNFMGCQFHPEKSGATGEKIIRNFLEMKL
ncbi:MAG: imidazole glycerol phosphate synthase subunit HisH [Bacteroidales bacterium]|nr:imidazole glycerol phosphate synthase subunit HisH [Bacteroidales bacterium]